MPGEDKSNVWHIVLHVSIHVTRATVHDVCKNIDAHLCVFEKADKEVKRDHFHLVCAQENTRAGIRTLIKKSFPGVKGKGDFTIHLPDQIKYPNQTEQECLTRWYEYLSKGTVESIDSEVDVIYKSPFINVESAHDTFHNKQKEFKNETAKLAKKKQDEQVLKRKEIVAKMLIAFKDVKMDEHREKRIFSAVFTEYRGFVDSRLLDMTVQNILFELDQTRTTEIAYERWKNKYYPRI